MRGPQRSNAGPGWRTGPPAAPSRPEIQHLEQAIAGHATMSMVRILTAGVLSLAHDRLGHHDLAADLAATACRLADAAGLRTASPVTLAYNAHAAHREGLTPRPGGALSKQEHSLLRLLPTSLTLRQIAAQRNVSVNTVKTQTRAIYRKLGAASRAEAVTNARAHGLIPHGSHAGPR